MYLVPLKAAIVEALRATFDAQYPETDFRNIFASIEYPDAQTSMPSLWVSYDDSQELTVAGIGHQEYVLDTNGALHSVTRWKFGGTITITVCAMTSLERDRLYDEVVRMFAFARVEEAVSEFRELIEQNDLIAMNINFDDLQPSGDNVGQVPWGTDDLLYEKSLSMDVIGEFVSNPSTRALALLSQVVVKEWVPPTELPPTFDGETISNRTAWH